MCVWAGPGGRRRGRPSEGAARRARVRVYFSVPAARGFVACRKPVLPAIEILHPNSGGVRTEGRDLPTGEPGVGSTHFLERT